MKKTTHYGRWFVSMIALWAFCGCAEEIQISAREWSNEKDSMERTTVHVVGVIENDSTYSVKKEDNDYWSYDYWNEPPREGEIGDKEGYVLCKTLSLDAGAGETIIISPAKEEKFFEVCKDINAKYLYIIADLRGDVENIKRCFRLPFDSEQWKEKVLKVIITPKKGIQCDIHNHD